MTQQSHPNNSDEVVSIASTASIGASTSSTDVYQQPVYAGQTEIVQNSGNLNVIDEIGQGGILATGPRFNIADSSHIYVGDQNNFHGHVTIERFYGGNALREHEPEDVESDKNVRVVNSSLPTPPIEKPSADRGLFKRHFKIIMILLTVTTVICAVTLITLRLVGGKKPNFVPTTTTVEPDTTVTPPEKLHYTFNRTQWGGRVPFHKEVLDEPVFWVIIKHTKTTTCVDLSSCFTAMQDLQNSDVGTSNLSDIRYNFVIGGDGNIYVGRGWGVRNAQMNNTIDIAYMGDFNVQKPDEWMVGAGKNLVVKGMVNGHLDMSLTKVVCHNQTEDTDSPGEFLFREIVLWSYYSSVVINGTSWNNDLR